MNLKYATIGLITGYLGAYVLDYLKNTQPANSTNFTTTLEEEREENTI